MTRRTRNHAGAARMIARLSPASSATVHSAVYSPARPAIESVRFAFLAQEAEHRSKRRQPDAAVPQSRWVQPRFVEFKAGGEQIRDALVKARDEQASNAGFNHAQVSDNVESVDRSDPERRRA